jgi:hypothetical protein
MNILGKPIKTKITIGNTVQTNSSEAASTIPLINLLLKRR